MSGENILVIDDEPQIRRVMRSTLSSHGYVISEAMTGEEGVDAVRKNKPDLVLLDMNMPGIGGLEACREIRESTDAPIIMLTVRNAERDKVAALDAGADDYVVKPFGIEELLARIRSALRRYAPGDAVAPFVTKEMSIDFEARTVTVRGNDVHLTPKEFDVLKHLIANQGKPLTHRRLLQAVWGPDYGEETENLRVVINQLRKKIEADPAKPKYILTEPWIGYRFQPPAPPPPKPHQKNPHSAAGVKMVSAPQTIGLQKRVCYTPAITWRPVTHFLSRVMLYPSAYSRRCARSPRAGPVKQRKAVLRCYFSSARRPASQFFACAHPCQTRLRASKMARVRPPRRNNHKSRTCASSIESMLSTLSKRVRLEVIHPQ